MLVGILRTDVITAYTGDSVLLPCSCTDPHAKPESFTWQKYNTRKQTWDMITNKSEQYRNRVQLGTAHSPGKLSLLISHLTEEDEGEYWCYLNQWNYKAIRLTIKGCILEHHRISEITAYTGGSVLLPCSCTDLHTKPENFTWRKRNTNRNTWDVIISESEQYRNRVQLGTAHSPGKLSLLISHLTEEDEGDYRCYLNQWNYKAIRLTIKGCVLEHNRELKLITAHTGDSVLLPCSCIELHNEPESFTWKKYNPNRNTWDVISSESEQYRNRVQLNTAHSPGNLSLLISHLTEEDEGDYRCQTKGNKHKDIKLYVSVCKDVVKPPTVLSGYVGGSVLLPCYCTELLAEPKTVRWSFINESDVIYPIDQTNRYTDRIQLVPAPRNFSLFISGLTKEDWGQYRCSISSYHLIDVQLQVTVSPQTLPYIPFALVTVIFLHIIVAVVYYTKRNKVSEMSRVHYNTAGGDGTASLQ
ncbi:polymeric immunoglobulin receptor-like isoform X2 [Electrophorus electricus]|nr:polymeric immunoglobulin receptor-like isoform X2 [Electrophorus electricus]